MIENSVTTPTGSLLVFTMLLTFLNFVSSFNFIPQQESYLNPGDFRILSDKVYQIQDLFHGRPSPLVTLATSTLRPHINQRNHNQSVDVLSISNQCKQFFQHYSYAKKFGQQWAYELQDASGKPSPGVMKGNLEFLGDFDQCIWIRVGNKLDPWSDPEPNFHVFRGRYCTISVQVNSPPNRNLTGFIVEKEARLGICTLSACSKADLAAILNATFSTDQTSPESVVNLVSCDGLEERQHQATPKFVKYTLWTVVTLLVAGTLTDMLIRSPALSDRVKPLWMQILTSFSVPRNMKSIILDTQTPDESRFINIFKAVSMLLVFHGHSNMIMRFVAKGSLNRHYDLLTKSVYHMSIVSGFLSVDMFLFISATITVKIVFPKIKQLVESKASSRTILHAAGTILMYRYIRLMPSLVFLMVCHVFCQNLMLGPLWAEYSDKWLAPCRSEWLPNVLLINNLLPWNPSKPNCAFHSWHLGLDMQLFVYALIFFILLGVKHPKAAIILNSALLVASILLKGIMTGYYGYPPMILSGNHNREDLYFESIYSKPWFRADSYITGLFFGYFCASDYQLNVSKRTKSAINFLVGFAMLYIVLTPAGYHTVENFSTLSIALFAALHRFVWSLCLSWIFYGAFNNEYSLLRTIANMRIWEIISNISYQYFLFHPLCLFIYFGISNVPLNMRVVHLITMEPGGFLLVGTISFITTLMVEWPLHNITRTLRNKKPKKEGIEGSKEI